jgi:cytochrome P450
MRDEMKTFMLAGHETSAAMMTWALYELMANQSLKEKVAHEGQAIFGQDWNAKEASFLPPREELAKLTLAEACLKVSRRHLACYELSLLFLHCFFWSIRNIHALLIQHDF